MALATGCVDRSPHVRRAPRASLAIAFTVLISAGWATAARAADAVTFWNEVANTMSVSRGPASMVDMAKVHIAIHDAVQSFEFRFEPYCGTVANASGAPAAAVAKAARDVLVGILPLTPPQLAALDATYNTFLSNNGVIGNAGIAAGQQSVAYRMGRQSADWAFAHTLRPVGGN